MIKTEILDNECISIGSYYIKRKNGKIITDRNAVIRGHKELKNVCETPELKDGFYLEIYVDRNIIEVFVNNGENENFYADSLKLSGMQSRRRLPRL